MDIVVNAIGLSGMVVLLAAFFLQQKGSIVSGGRTYLWMNLFGAVLVLISLMRFWNLASFLLECAWMLISLYGLFKLKQAAA